MKKEKDIYYSLAFSKHTPTAFVIGTPFQLLCAWNAIAEFEITEYKFILVLERNNVRNNQVFNMLHSRNMEYEVYYPEDYRIRDVIYGNIQGPHSQFTRIMSGEILYLPNIAICSMCADKDSVIVYMDDGAASIRVLKGHTMYLNKWSTYIKHVLRPNNSRKIMEEQIYSHMKAVGLHDFGFFYTIYADIKTHHFITYPNKIDKLHNVVSEMDKEEAILIIGAETKDYSHTIDISIPEYEGILWCKLQEIKQRHPDKRIIYIPHGRDKNKAIRTFCEFLGIEYYRIEMAIEYFVLNCNYEFTHIYGFFSTAHYTLKLLTKALVVDWVIMNKHSAAWHTISEITSYYRTHGIVIDEIAYPSPSLTQYFHYMITKIKGLLRI